MSNNEIRVDVTLLKLYPNGRSTELNLEVAVQAREVSVAPVVTTDGEMRMAWSESTNRGYSVEYRDIAPTTLPTHNLVTVEAAATATAVASKLRDLYIYAKSDGKVYRNGEIAYDTLSNFFGTVEVTPDGYLLRREDAFMPAVPVVVLKSTHEGIEVDITWSSLVGDAKPYALFSIASLCQPNGEIFDSFLNLVRKYEGVDCVRPDILSAFRVLGSPVVTGKLLRTFSLSDYCQVDYCAAPSYEPQSHPDAGFVIAKRELASKGAVWDLLSKLKDDVGDDDSDLNAYPITYAEKIEKLLAVIGELHDRGDREAIQALLDRA